jgi:hypothetical protein
MTHPFTPDELELLRAHGFVLFADRVIFAAQPPMPEARIADIAAGCSGPLPDDLLDLWRLTGGGTLDYDLAVDVDGHREAISWNEIFYDGSDAYHDLEGWIEHERQCAQEAAEDRGKAWSGKLPVLPIGGFEYCDRIYVVVEPGKDQGHVLAWKQGLPGWDHQLQADGLATIAPGLREAFAALTLESDPLAPVDRFPTGSDFLEAVREQVDDAGLDRTLADRLVAFYRNAYVDWRPLLEAGTLAAHVAQSASALRHAIGTDDAALIVRLAGAGIDLGHPVRGDARALEVALITHAYVAAQALVDAGADVPKTALREINRAAPGTLVSALLARGAQADAQAIAKAAACGGDGLAAMLAGAADKPEAIAREIESALASYEGDLAKVQAGKLGHYLGPAGLEERIANLRRFQATLAPPPAEKRGWKFWRRG